MAARFATWVKFEEAPKIRDPPQAIFRASPSSIHETPQTDSRKHSQPITGSPSLIVFKLSSQQNAGPAPDASFGNTFSLISGDPPLAIVRDLPRVLHDDDYAGQPVPSVQELDVLQWGQQLNGPTGASMAFDTTIVPPQILTELEMSRPSDEQQEPVDAVQSLHNPPINRWRLGSACLMCFANGLNDSAPGALIPHIEAHYSIGYAIVSLIFLTNAAGFISTALVTHQLHARLGRAKLLVLAQLLMTSAYVMIVCTPPWPVVVFAFFLSGLGMAFTLALNNPFCANLSQSTFALSAFHGAYGIGGTIGPLIATTIVSHGQVWSLFYLVTLGLSVLNGCLAYWAYHNYERELPTPLLVAEELSSSHRAQGVGRQGTSSSHRAGGVTLREALHSKTTLLGAIFIFAYQGAEVSISGWTVSFLLTNRNTVPPLQSPTAASNASIGYVTAGFWAGITLGRFLLIHPCRRVGEKVAIFGIVLGAACFQVLVWRLPNLISEAIAVAIVGLLLGPVYACAIVVFSRLLTRRMQMSSLALVSAFGSSGGALAPFLTGLIAQREGTWVLFPISIGLFALMIVCWASLNRVWKRME